jgi:septum formation protein
MLILASASPRRRELLAQAGYTFHVFPAHIPEHRHPAEAPIEFAKRLALEKAEAVFRDKERDLGDDPDPLVVLGADTIVVLGDEVLGKPVDEADAARMLRLLSGRTHDVITGVAVATSSGLRVTAENTRVTMDPISEDEIREYVASGEPMDKAGAYAIQGLAGRWIPRIEGCYFNVVGLPLATVRRMLNKQL